MAVRSSGGWAFAPARPHQREGRSHPFCISPLLGLINWVPNTQAEYVMRPSQQRPLPTWTPPPPPLHLPPNLIALLPPHPSLSPSPPPPPSLCLTSVSSSLSLILIPLYLSLHLCVRWQSPKHISIHLVFWAGEEGGGGGGWRRGWKKMKKYEKQFNNNNDADDKINYAQGWRMRKKRRRPQQQSLT